MPNVKDVKLVGWNRAAYFVYYVGIVEDTGEVVYGIDFCDTGIDWFYEKPTDWEEMINAKN